MSGDRPDTIRVRVLLFSTLREKAGKEHVVLHLPAPATGADLLTALVEQYPAVAPWSGVAALAVNEAYAPRSVVLADGDEVAIITPVSGG